LHNSGFVTALVVGEPADESDAAATLPPVPPAFAVRVAPVAGPGPCPVEFCNPLALFADLPFPAGADGLLIPESAYQKQKTPTTTRAAQINVRFTRYDPAL